MGSVFSNINSRHFASRINHEDAAERLRVLDALEARGDAELLIKKALALLSDGDETVRQRAAEALSRLGTKEAAEATIDAWEQFDDTALDAAVEALARIGRPAIVPTRKQLNHGKAAVRAAAATVLGRVDARTVVPDLARGLADTDPRVICASARALGNLKAEQCLDDLGVVYRRKPACRPAVLDALETIGSPAAVDRIRRALNDGDETVREHARGALQRLDHNE